MMERTKHRLRAHFLQLLPSTITAQQWPLVLTVTFFGSAVYKVTNLREVFYHQMQVALHLSNLQIGMLASVVGITSVVSNLFGGYLADRVQPRYLISSAAFVSSLLTLIYLSYPPFWGLIGVHIGITVCGMLLFWASYIRLIGRLGQVNQTSVYGLVEGVRSLLGIILPLGAIGLVNVMATARLGLRAALFYYAGCFALSGVAALKWLPDEPRIAQSQHGATQRGAYRQLFGHPQLYLIILVVFGTYAVFGLMSYTTPYMTLSHQFSPQVVSVVAIIRQYGVGCLSMPLFGYLSRHVQSPTKVIWWGLWGLLLAVSGLLVSQSAVSLVLSIGLIGFLDNGIRGIYFATQAEMHLPAAVMGVSAGLISGLGFSPDVVSFLVVGRWLDRLAPATAYRLVWWTMLGAVVLALLAASGLWILKAHHECHRNGKE